jgi:hypothetical protein
VCVRGGVAMARSGQWAQTHRTATKRVSSDCTGHGRGRRKSNSELWL